jgi:hypothetical protein
VKQTLSPDVQTSPNKEESKLQKKISKLLKNLEAKQMPEHAPVVV